MRTALFVAAFLLMQPVNLHSQEKQKIPVEIAHGTSVCDNRWTNSEKELFGVAEEAVRSHLLESQAFRVMSPSESSSRNRIKLTTSVRIDDLGAIQIRRVVIFMQFVPANESWGRLWWIIQGGGWGSSAGLSQQSALESLEKDLNHLLGEEGVAFLNLVFAKWTQPKYASLDKSIDESAELHRTRRQGHADCEIYAGRGY